MEDVHLPQVPRNHKNHLSKLIYVSLIKRWGKKQDLNLPPMVSQGQTANKCITTKITKKNTFFITGSVLLQLDLKSRVPVFSLASGSIIAFEDTGPK